MAIVLIMWNIGGALVWMTICGDDVGPLSRAVGFEFLDYRWVYKNYQLNFFGAALLTLVLNLICPVISFGYWFGKICTVGR